MPRSLSRAAEAREEARRKYEETLSQRSTSDPSYRALHNSSHQIMDGGRTFMWNLIANEYTEKYPVYGGEHTKEDGGCSRRQGRRLHVATVPQCELVQQTTTKGSGERAQRPAVQAWAESPAMTDHTTQTEEASSPAPSLTTDVADEGVSCSRHRTASQPRHVDPSQVHRNHSLQPQHLSPVVDRPQRRQSIAECLRPIADASTLAKWAGGPRGGNAYSPVLGESRRRAASSGPSPPHREEGGVEKTMRCADRDTAVIPETAVRRVMREIQPAVMTPRARATVGCQPTMTTTTDKLPTPALSRRFSAKPRDTKFLLL